MYKLHQYSNVNKCTVHPHVVLCQKGVVLPVSVWCHTHAASRLTWTEAAHYKPTNTQGLTTIITTCTNNEHNVKSQVHNMFKFGSLSFCPFHHMTFLLIDLLLNSSCSDWSNWWEQLSGIQIKQSGNRRMYYFLIPSEYRGNAGIKLLYSVNKVLYLYTASIKIWVGSTWLSDTTKHALDIEYNICKNNNENQFFDYKFVYHNI